MPSEITPSVRWTSTPDDLSAAKSAHPELQWWLTDGGTLCSCTEETMNYLVSQFAQSSGRKDPLPFLSFEGIPIAASDRDHLNA